MVPVQLIFPGFCQARQHDSSMLTWILSVLAIIIRCIDWLSLTSFNLLQVTWQWRGGWKMFVREHSLQRHRIIPNKIKKTSLMRIFRTNLNSLRIQDMEPISWHSLISHLMDVFFWIALSNKITPSLRCSKTLVSILTLLERNQLTSLLENYCNFSVPRQVHLHKILVDDGWFPSKKLQFWNILMKMQPSCLPPSTWYYQLNEYC